jgi:glycosyltransferase 2 family protein
MAPRPARRRGVPHRLFRTALLIVPIGVLGNLTFTWLATDGAVLRSIGALPRGYLALALGLGLVPWLTNTLRLRLWVRLLGHPLSLRDAFRLTLATDLGSAVSPTAVGGGFLKWGMLVQRGVSPGAAASVGTLINVEDACFFLLAIPVALALSDRATLAMLPSLAGGAQADAATGVLVWAGIALGAWLVVRLVLAGRFGRPARRHSSRLLARARRGLRRAWRDARAVFGLVLRRGKSRFALGMSLAAVQWSCRYSVISALAAFLGAPVDPYLFFFLQWIVFTLMAVVPTPGAAGGAEATFFFVYSPVLPDHILAIATAGWRLLTFYLQLGLAAVVFMLMRETAGLAGSRTPEV